MSKALRSYPEHQQIGVAERRVRGPEGGLGYHAAINFLIARRRLGKSYWEDKLAEMAAKFEPRDKFEEDREERQQRFKPKTPARAPIKHVHVNKPRMVRG